MTDTIRSQFDELQLPVGAPAVDKRRRGYGFEKFLESLLEHDGLSPRIRIRPSGEEIDGSFHMDHRTFLLEAKWHAKPLPASVIYAFKGKVDGKLEGTIGVFVSMSGYSKDAINALTAGKDLNVVLFDEKDVEAAIIHGFAPILRIKLRAAAEEGVVFYPFTSTLMKVNPDSVSVDLEVANSDVSALSKQVLILCEGSDDRRVLNRIGQRILEHRGLSANLRIMAAQGKRGIPRVANAIYPILPDGTPIIVVVDGDGEEIETERMIVENTTVPIKLVIIDPEIEVWLAQGAEDPRNEVRRLARLEQIPISQYVDNQIKVMDINEKSASEDSFREFYDALFEAVGGNV